MRRRNDRKASVLSALFVPLLMGAILNTPTFADFQPPVKADATLPQVGVAEGVFIPGTSDQTKRKRLSYLPGKLVVKMKSVAPPSSLTAMEAEGAISISQMTLSKQQLDRFRNMYIVSAEQQLDLDTLAAQLRADEAVEYVEPIGIAYTQLVPNDPLYSQQWSHKRTGAEAGWNISTGAPSVVIAVIDTGVAYSHPDLAGNIWRDSAGNPGKDLVNIDVAAYLNAGYSLIPGEDYQGADVDPSDFYGHGTHVAGIAAASGNNGKGVSGVCPGCRIMPVRAGFALRQGGQTFGMLQSDHIAAAIIYAADNGARVINMSFGGPPSQLVWNALDYAYAKGAILVAAAGNENVSSTDMAYPAAYGKVLAVAATDFNDQKAFYSNYGGWVEVAAPGGDSFKPILSTVPTAGILGSPTGYSYMYGTSMAAPYAAGSAGLILSKNANLSGGQVVQAVKQGVDLFNIDLPDSQYYLGTGRVNLEKGLRIDSISSATARISAPSDDFISGGVITVTGSATAPYRIFYGQGLYPADWTEFGSGPAVTDGVLATLDSAALPSPFDTYTLKLVAQDQAGKIEEIVQGRIGRHFLPGWPKQYSFDDLPAPVWNSPTLTDLDLDGYDEILIAGRDGVSRGIINVFSKDGSPSEGSWPKAAPLIGTSFDFGAAVGDINGDGTPEVVAGYYGLGHGLICWDRFGNQLWTKVLEPGNPALNIRLADLDGDGKLEIITQARNSKIYVLNGSGAVVWSFSPGEWDTIYNEKRVAAADLDGDGKQEIVKNVITSIRFEPGDIYRIMGGSLLVLNPDGTVRWKHDWPEPGEPLGMYWQVYPTASPLVGDLNGDGKQEIMVRVNAWNGDNTGNSEVWTRFYAFDRDGALVPGWPVSVSGFPAFSELALGDTDLDGHSELVGGAGGKLHAITDTGAFQFPSIELNAVSNPVVADVTGDGLPDILVNDGSAFQVIGHDGSVSSLAIKVRDTGSSNVHNTPFATDLDKNGTRDLIFLEWQPRPIIWAWDLRIPTSAKLEQSITFNSAVVTYGDSPLDLSTLASGGGSGKPVTFTLLSGPGLLSGPNNAALTSTGAGEIVIRASQAGNLMYNPAPDVQQTITVRKTAATVSLGNLSQSYDGSPKQATASTDPPGKSVRISYDGSAAPPVNAGSYAVVATIDDPNYSGSSSATLIIAKAAATITLGQLSATYDGSPKPATATTQPPGKTVCLSYNGSAAAPVKAGSYTVVATILDPNYTGAATATVVIGKATPTLVWATPAGIFSGTPLSDQQLNAVANVPGTFSYTPSFGYLPPAGTHTLSVLFTPADSINYQSASATTTMTVVDETFSVQFVADANGTLEGATSQTVIRGGYTTSVTALPAEGYHFVKWTGTGGFVTSTANPLTVSNVTTSQTITAHFALIDGVVVPEEGKTRPNLSDALRVLKMALGEITPSDDDLVHADIAPLGEQNKPKGDGVIDIHDVIGILRMTVGLLY